MVSAFFSRLRKGPLIMGMMVLAAVLRWPLLHGSFWLDEAAQALESVRPWHEQLKIAYDFQPPLFHVLVHGLSYVSHSEWWLRMASFIPGLASIALVMHLAYGWWGKQASFWAGLLLATSSLHVYFSQELRPYMLAVFFAMLSYALFDAWSKETLVWKKNGWRVGVLGLVVALGMYSSYVLLFWWPAIFVVALLWKRKSAMLVFMSGLVAAILFAPWALTGLREQLAVGAELRETLPGWDAVVSASAAKAIPLVLAKFLSGVERVDFSWRYAVLLGVPLAALTTALSYSFWKEKKERKELLWLVGLFVVPLLLAWIFSFVTPVVAPKRVLYLLPVLMLLVARTVRFGRGWGLIVVTLFLSWNVWSLGQYWSNPHLQRENWRGLVTEIETQFPPTSTVLVMSLDEPLAPWRWYSTQKYEVVSTGLAPLQSSEQAHELLSPWLNTKNILLFDYLRDLSDPYKVTETALQEAGYQEKGLLDYPEIGFVRVYIQDRLYAGRVL